MPTAVRQRRHTDRISGYRRSQTPIHPSGKPNHRLLSSAVARQTVPPLISTRRAEFLAAYAGIAPVTHRSGSSIRGEFPARSGNHKLKRALFLSTFAALHAPASRAYYDRKRAEGKKHNAALICLSRRRCDVLFAMLRSGELYRCNTAAA